MKTHSITLLFVFLFSTSALRSPAITSPETNALISEVEIGAPTAIAEGRFGQLIAARSNLVVIGYKTTLESSPSGPLAAVYWKSSVQGNFDFQGELRVPGATNLSVWDLATDGTRIGIAASTAGASVIYRFAHDGQQWSLETSLVPFKNIGSFAMSENIIVAGATAPLGEGSGKVLVFEKTDGSWQETSIVAPDGFYWNYNFGKAVATQGGNILIGSTGDFRIDEGHAYIYSRVDGVWRLQADLSCGNVAPSFSLFGERVAIDGDTALVTHYSGRFNSGHVDVFQRSDLGWSRVGGVSSGYGHEDYFGLVTDIGGKNNVVGAPEVAWGVAYLFRKNGAAFDRLQLSQAPYHGEYPHDEFGTSVAVDGNTIYVGAPLYNGSVTNQGVVYVFEFEFPVQLHSSWARHSDNSFHFKATELKVGKIYTVETSSTLGTDWSFVKQFTAYTSDMNLDVAFSTESGRAYFRLLQN